MGYIKGLSSKTLAIETKRSRAERMMMIRSTGGKLLIKKASAAAAAAMAAAQTKPPIFSYINNKPSSSSSSSSSSSLLVRFYCCGSNYNGGVGPDDHVVDAVSIQMINYGLSHARSLKSDESYAQGLLVLEQCELQQQQQQGRASTENTRGIILLAMSSLLSESGDLGGAMEKLEKIQDLTNSSLGVRVAAIEGLIGLNLEMGQQDDASSKLADSCLELFKTNPKEEHGSHALEHRAKAIKGLVELVLGNHEIAEKYLGVAEAESCSGNAMLTHAEFLHTHGNFKLAKELYNKTVQVGAEIESFDDPSNLAACNMLPTEVLLGANCALGQLEAQSGNFADAEEILTKALTRAEEQFGSRHPKVGVILTCIALMFRRKAQLERSSSLLIQEGLFRKAIELLKAPPLETEGEEAKVERRDIVALARGGYSEILCLQQNRKGEGERMRNWAESTWKNHRLSLAEALEISEPSSKIAVLDSRICRVL